VVTSGTVPQLITVSNHSFKNEIEKSASHQS
jgi:hypothetical protein